MNERPTNVRYIVLIGLCLMAGIAYIQRGCLGVVETTIQRDLGLTAKDTGLASGIFFLTYALFQIPTGLLVDRWGARKGLLLFGTMSAVTLALGAGTLIVGAGTLIMGASAGMVILVGSRALMGVAQAGLFPAATRCLATWFPIRRRAFAAGFFQAFMSTGAALGAYMAGRLLLLNVDWPWIFISFAIPGIIWSVWFYWWYRDRPEDHKSVNEAEKLLLKPPDEQSPKTLKGPTPWLRLAIQPQLFWLCISQLFRAGANAFWMVRCPAFLENVYSIGRAEAAELSSIPFIGVVLGSLGGGILADQVLARTGSKFKSRNGVSIGTAIIGVGFFLLAYFVHMGPYVAVMLLFLAAIFSSGGNACAYSVSIDIGGLYIAIIFGAMNMMGNLGAALFPNVFYLNWTSEFGVATAPILMATLYFLGAMGWCFLNPNGTILEKRHAPVV